MHLYARPNPLGLTWFCIALAIVTVLYVKRCSPPTPSPVVAGIVHPCAGGWCDVNP